MEGWCVCVCVSGRRRQGEGGSLAATIPNLEITENTATRSRSAQSLECTVRAPAHSLHAHAGYVQKGLSHTPWQMLTACLRSGSPGLLWRSGSSTISSPLSTEGRVQKFASMLGFDISAFADLAAKVRGRHTTPRGVYIYRWGPGRRPGDESD
jgi:hypothetical protein